MRVSDMAIFPAPHAIALSKAAGGRKIAIPSHPTDALRRHLPGVPDAAILALCDRFGGGPEYIPMAPYREWRNREIIRRTAAGESRRQIAVAVGLAENTIRNLLRLRMIDVQLARAGIRGFD